LRKGTEEKVMGYKRRLRELEGDPEGSGWRQAEAIDWDARPAKRSFDENAPLYEWFADGKVNTCWNAVDRHVEAGRGEQVAIIYDSPITGTKHKITYAELQDRVAASPGRCAPRA
jgi:propionyl-CoA synthetase